MKKQSSIKRKTYKSSMLYLDEIQEIIEEVTKYSKVSITINNFDLESTEELLEFSNKVIKNIIIRIAQPYFKLEFDGKYIIISNEDNIQSMGLATLADQLLKRHVKYFSRILLNPAMFITGFILNIGFGIFQLIIINFDQVAKIILLCFQLTGTFILLINLISHFRNRNLVFLKHKDNYPSFIKRQKDNILLAFISALAGGAITLIIEKII